MGNQFFHAKPITQPEDIKPFLAKQERHWKKGYSAYELAYSWVKAEGIPASVNALLQQAPELQDMELIEAFFEKETPLRSFGRPSQTDILALIGDGAQYIVLGIEGKVNETFGPLVSEWLIEASPHKQTRLAVLCETLGLVGKDISSLRYQLLHRTAATIYEAQRYKTSQALMLVHSFSPNHLWFDDFQKFANAIGAPVARVNELSAPITLENMKFQLGWVADKIS